VLSPARTRGGDPGKGREEVEEEEIGGSPAGGPDPTAGGTGAPGFKDKSPKETHRSDQ
jgi:hypothetical protein